MKVANKEMSVRKLWTSNELLDAVSARKAVSIGKLRGEALRTALSEMRDRDREEGDRIEIYHSDTGVYETINNISTYKNMYGQLMTLIDDIALLLAIAAGNGPSFVRRNALHRIDELCDRTPLDVRGAQRLVACLSEKSLIAFAVALMDMSDYDWPSHCDVTSVGALCEALYSCTSIHETVLLEDACDPLAHRRPDLLSSIGACAPDHYPMVA